MSDRYCKNISLLAIGSDNNGTIVKRVRCKQWSCAYCAYINKVQWHMRILRGMENNKQWSQFAFLTITAHEKTRTPVSSYKTLQHALSKLLKRMRRANAYNDMPYVRVFEPHRDGSLHAHLIIHWTTDIDATDKENNRWLKDNARATGAGYMTSYETITPAYDAERTDNSYTQAMLQVSGYVTKYMSKDLQATAKNEAYPRMRIIQASQHFPPELATNLDNREWRVQQSYRFDDYITDTKPVKDADVGMQITAHHFDPRFDNRYAAKLHFQAHLEMSKV